MSDKHLQRVTECLSDIGQPISRRALSPSGSTLLRKSESSDNGYFTSSVIHDDAQPADLFPSREKLGPSLR